MHQNKCRVHRPVAVSQSARHVLKHLRGTQVCATERIELREDIATPRRDSDITAWVNVIYGCNERCTYVRTPLGL